MRFGSEEHLRIVRYLLPHLSVEDLRAELDDAVSHAQEEAESERDRVRRRASAERERVNKRLQEFLAARSGILIFYTLLILVFGIGIILLIIASSHSARVKREANEEIQRLNSIEASELARIDKQLLETEDQVNAELEKIVEAYQRSVASAEEVGEHIQNMMDEVRVQVNDALGIHDDQVLDERCAEITIPTFFVSMHLPETVRADIERSAVMLRAYREEIVKPIVSVFRDVERANSFVVRVYSLLGLVDGDESEHARSVNSLNAVRFDSARRRFQAGHYFAQTFVCAPDFVGIFHAYVNILTPSVPHTVATNLFYQEIVTIRVESEQVVHGFIPNNLMIDQHTRSLVLSMGDGKSYRLSNDVGSSASPLRGDGGQDSGEMHSSPDKVFSSQIENLRSLVRDTRRHQLHKTESSIPEA